VNTELWS